MKLKASVQSFLQKLRFILLALVLGLTFHYLLALVLYPKANTPVSTSSQPIYTNSTNPLPLVTIPSLSKKGWTEGVRPVCKSNSPAMPFVLCNPVCGNRLVEEGEACDGGVHCTASCTLP